MSKQPDQSASDQSLRGPAAGRSYDRAAAQMVMLLKSPEAMQDGANMIRILLAEDDDAMRCYLARALEQAGYEVVAVADGAAAIPWLEREQFDLLLSDIVMPEIGGIELARHCEHVSASTKIMLITGFAAVTLRASREAPRAKLLSKPFHLRELVLEVERLFDDSPAKQSG